MTTVPSIASPDSALQTTPQSLTGSLGASNPQLSVGSYVSQQLGSLNNGLGNQTGPVDPQSLGAAGVRPPNPLGQQSDQLYSNMQNNNDRALGQIQLNSALMQRRNQLAQQQTAQPQQTTTTTTTSAPQASAASAGAAYQPNGQLSAARNQALSTATSYLGDRYVLGGTTHAGIDCSGLVMKVYDQFGLGRYLDSHLAGHQAQAVPGVRTSVSNLRPGDLVCWNDGSHIAIYAGNGNIIEAANERVGTVERKLWSNQVFGIALRLPGE